MQMMAIALPLAWNYVVRGKVEQAHAAADAKLDATTAYAERVAVEMLVNERRAERALPAYDFDRHDREQHEALWTQVEELHRTKQKTEAAEAALAATSGAPAIPGLPVFGALRVPAAQYNAAMGIAPPPPDASSGVCATDCRR
jgi:hypothetical protein